MSQKSENLNPRQQEAVDHKSGPLLIIAGAGSGKTKTLTSRLAALIKNGASPENIIAVTFTNKAANEMRTRISNFQFPISNFQYPFIGTFHSLGARILKAEAKLLGRTPAFTIFDEDDSLSALKNVLKKLNISKEQLNPLALRGKISKVKNELLEEGEYLDPKSLAIFKKYEEELLKNNAFDFDDLIEKVVRIFRDHPEALEKYRRRFQYVLVDEFQDVNTAQYLMVKLLAEKHLNLSVVGDDAQSIYRFRGSDFRNFLNFENDWPNAKIVKLEQNYRSAGNIITAASAVIKNNKFQKPKELWTENPAGELVKVAAAEDKEQEADWVANKITTITNDNDHNKKIINHGHAHSIAILYRTNAQSRAVEQALISYNIPYKIFGGLKFYERKEIKDIVAGLRIAFNPKDSVSAERIAKTFNKDIAAYLLKELPRLSRELSILQLISFFLENSRYFDYLDKKFKNSGERIENINELIQFAGEFKDLGEFLERVSLLQSADQPAKTLMASGYTLNPINLMTIHLAKGLEFENVFVIGCNEGVLPHQMSYGTMDELEEERRLMYVAMTRAKEKLFLSFYGLASRFLYEIPPELTEPINLGGRKKMFSEEEDIYVDEEYW